MTEAKAKTPRVRKPKAPAEAIPATAAPEANQPEAHKEETTVMTANTTDIAMPVIKSKLEILAERRDAAQAAYDTEKASQERAEALQSVKAGDLVEFMFGRKENRAQHTGQVRAVIETDKGRSYTVLFGEGVNEKITAVPANGIVGFGEGFKANHNGGASVQAAANADPLEGIE